MKEGEEEAAEHLCQGCCWGLNKPCVWGRSLCLALRKGQGWLKGGGQLVKDREARTQWFEFSKPGRGLGQPHSEDR